MVNVINLFFAVLILFCWLMIIKKTIQDRFSPVKTIPAKVVDTYVSERVSRSPGVGGNRRYIVVFEANGKRLSFSVSEFSYQSYQKEDKGMLTYKGSQIISFQ